MADSVPRRASALAPYRSALFVVASWVGLLGLGRAYRLWLRADDAIYRILSGFPALAQIAHHWLDVFTDSFSASYGVTVAAATLIVPLGFVLRLVARARVRAGASDPLAALRSWRDAHPALTLTLLAAFPVLTQLLWARNLWWRVSHYGVLANLAFFVAPVLYGWAQVRLMRSGARDLLAPTLPATTDAAPALDPDAIRFAAVAVTRETKGAVAGLAALTLGVAAWVATRPILDLFRDPHVLTVLASYVGVAAVSALVFRRASRIAVGVDGIYVGGSSRPCFYAYRGLDEVRVRNGDIELVKRERVVLRLQLHGQDATRREAIVARITDALARAKEVDRDAAAHFVTSRSTEKVSDAVQGKLDYRMPSVSEDALWSLVEGQGVDAPTRQAAAEALSRRGVSGDRARFRVAAAHCADPRVRVVLEDLGSDVEEAGEPRSAARLRGGPGEEQSTGGGRQRGHAAQ